MCFKQMFPLGFYRQSPDHFHVSLLSLGKLHVASMSKFSGALVIRKIVICVSSPACCDQVVCLWNDRVLSLCFSGMWTVVSLTSILRTGKLEVVIKYWHLLICPTFSNPPPHPRQFFKQFFQTIDFNFHGGFAVSGCPVS